MIRMAGRFAITRAQVADDVDAGRAVEMVIHQNARRARTFLDGIDRALPGPLRQ